MTRQVDAQVIDRLFERLGLLYGPAWERARGVTPIADVKTLWGEYLHSFDVDDVAYALEHLTEKMPNVIAFRDLCRAAPKKAAPMLERPKVDPLRMAEEIAKQAKIKEAFNVKRADYKAWAPKILQRAADGEKISPTVLKMARDTVAGWQP